MSGGDVVEAGLDGAGVAGQSLGFDDANGEAQ